MCDKINWSNQNIQITVANERTGMNPYQVGTFYRDNFTAASNAIAKSVCITYPQQQHNRGQYSNVSGLTGGQFGGGRGRRGQGGRGGKSSGSCYGQRTNDCKDKCFCNKVDVTDMTRKFSNDEYEKLPPHIRTMIWEARKEKKRPRDDLNEETKTIFNVQTNTQNDDKNKDKTEKQESNNTKKGSHNGRRFGSNAYSQRKGEKV